MQTYQPPTGKKVVLVGNGPGVLFYTMGTLIDAANNYVVRFNMQPVNAHYSQFTGTRTDLRLVSTDVWLHKRDKLLPFKHDRICVVDSNLTLTSGGMIRNSTQKLHALGSCGFDDVCMLPTPEMAIRATTGFVAISIFQLHNDVHLFGFSHNMHHFYERYVPSTTHHCYAMEKLFIEDMILDGKLHRMETMHADAKLQPPPKRHIVKHDRQTNAGSSHLLRKLRPSSKRTR